MATPERWLHQMEFVTSDLSVGDARAFVSLHLLGHDCHELVDDVQLVVSELATNALVHGDSGFTVTLRGFDGVVVVEVEDGSQVGPTLRAASALDTNGRGVAIVNTLSSKWGVDHYEGGGKSVWAEFVR